MRYERMDSHYRAMEKITSVIPFQAIAEGKTKLKPEEISTPAAATGAIVFLLRLFRRG